LAEDLAGSVSRLERGRRLMEACPKPVDLDKLGGFLRDHESRPVSLCWHDPEGRVKTVFSALIDLTAFTVDLAVGNPCCGEYRRLWG
jgi:predicted transposase YdaD